MNPRHRQEPIKSADPTAKIAQRFTEMSRIPSSGSAPRLGTVFGLATVTGIGLAFLPFRDEVTAATVALVLVVAVVLAALVGGTPASIVTALGAAAVLNLGYIRPFGRLDIADVDDGTELVAFLVVAGLVGQLVTGLARRRAQVTRAAAHVEALDRRVSELRDEHTALARRATRAEELETLDRQRSALLRAVSHDLRTPLASIRAVATDLREGVEYDDETRVELLTTVCDEVDRLDRFVANLLSLSRIDAGAFAPEPQAVDAGELVEERLRALAPLLRDVRVRTELPAALPLLEADYSQLGQVLTNLLANASRHAPADTEVWVAVAPVDDALRFEVSDQGRGVPPEDADRIFEPFVHGADRRSSGLGLAICRAIVQAHGGTIGVRRTFGGGATFWFTIPLHASEPQ